MKRILVVDDDRMNCVMAKGALKEQYEVYTVNSGEEALAFLEQQEPVDMILMDIMMPEMSGKEAAKKIKEEAGLSSRCMPFDQEQLSDKCVCCGKPAKTMAYWGKAY